MEVGRATSPWNFNIDLRLQRTLKLGSRSILAFLYIQNVLNRRNVTNIYWRTGKTDDDGFIALHPPEFVEDNPGTFELYQEINLNHRQHFALVNGGDIFGRPRQIRFGMELEF